MSSATIGPIDSRQFRTCCGRFTTGITVVTTKVDDTVHGMTANGFMSVSLEPPLIAISLGHNTRLHQFMPQSMRYGISILDESQLAISNHFAGRPDDTLKIPFIEKVGMPLLDGALAHLVARVVDAHEAGDHTLYIAEVEYLNYADGRPLVYYAGGYNQLKADPKPEHMSWFDNEVFFFPVSDF
ncbi:MAG: flavin reductase family protein [Burkholderiales bacterium]|nr:flavin reductase family protein [Anaerolineae bacterium]